MELILAPLAGYTDKAFRQIAVENGADKTVTEMVSAEGLARKSVKTEALLEKFDESENLVIQLFAPDEDPIRRCLENPFIQKAQYIDINSGCPVPKVVKTGAGSAMMKNPETIYKIVSLLKNSTSASVSVKFRLGWDEDSMNYPEYARACAEAGADALTLHTRTRSQGYSGVARKEHFCILRGLFPKDDPSSPLLYASGDVFTAEDALCYIRDYGADGVMFARGAIGNPFIIRQTKDLLTSGTYKQADIKEKIQTAIHHLELAIGYYGESLACREMRKHVLAYLKGLKGGAKAKQEIAAAKTFKEYQQILSSLL